MLTLYIYFIVDTPSYHILTALQCSEALWQDSVRERKVGGKKLTSDGSTCLVLPLQECKHQNQFF